MKDIEKVEIIRYKGSISEDRFDTVVVEKVLIIYVNGKLYSSLMYTPGDERELIVGFLFNQGVIKDKEEIIELDFISEKIVKVMISREAALNYGEIMAITTGCGGGSIKLSFIESKDNPIINSKYKVSHETIVKNMKHINSLSSLFKETGGVHGCGIFSGEELIIIKEDIGRHNAADKAIGAALLQRINFEDKMIFTTGRVSGDMVVKTALAGIPILVSHSAPSNLAITLANSSNITLVGFVRGDKMNIYSGGSRIL